MFVKKLKRNVVLRAYEPVQELVRQEESVVQPIVRQEEPVVPAQEKKARCADGTRRFQAIGPDCYTAEQIEEHKKNKTQKLKKK
jgi:hypothetical protein